MADNPTEDLFETQGPREVADGVYWLSEFSNVIAFETGEGLLLVDTADEGRAPGLAERLREVTDAPVHTAVYTHGHADHVHGLGAFLLDDQADPVVVAHENVPRRFERYARTRGHNEAINARQFGGAVDAGDQPASAGASPFRVPDYPPTRLYRDELTLEVGELTFELHHGRGETDDHTWLYCPERDVLCSGDFLISASPNPGNPQKVQRYPGEWAAELRRMEALGPGTLCPGHGEPMQDPERIRERLRTTEDYLDTIVERTLDALNDGSPPHVDVVHEVELPDPDAPWLAEVYDEGEFIVRNVIRYYGGWWTGRPSELKPAPREAVAAEIADLCDGPVALAERASDLVDDGEFRLACHLADYAVEAAPEDDAVQELAAAVYDARAEQEASLMATNLYNSAAAYTEAGRPFR